VSADLERMAVASPGQTVFLRVLVARSTRELDQMREQAYRFTERSGVRVVILSKDVEVAKIEDEECRCALIRTAYDLGHTAGLAAVRQEEENNG